MVKELKEIENKWIAIDKKSNKIINKAETLEQLFKMLKTKKDRVIIFKVPKLNANYVTFNEV